MGAVARYVARHPEDEHYALVLDTVARNENKVKNSDCSRINKVKQSEK